MTTETTSTLDAGGSPLERGVRALEPERAAFEAWLNPGRYEKETHQLAWLAWRAARAKGCK